MNILYFSAALLCASSALAGPLYPQMVSPSPVFAQPQHHTVSQTQPVYKHAAPQPIIAQPSWQPQPVAAVATPVQAPAPAKQAWSGTAEAGLMYSTGNTERENLNAAGEISYRPSDWEFILGASLINTQENDVQTDEEYRVNGQVRRFFTDRDYGYLEADYVKDRFSGFDYRITEVLGYGREWYNTDAFAWSSEIGAGFQQVKTSDGESSNDPLLRLRNDLDWQITDSLSFMNGTQVDISDLITLRNEAALKNKLSESLFVKLGVDVEYLSDVPTGTKNTDTDVYVNLAYEY